LNGKESGDECADSRGIIAVETDEKGANFPVSALFARFVTACLYRGVPLRPHIWVADRL
jgi:hypothetical protein